MVWLSPDVSTAQVFDIGPTLSDAPPPRMALRAGSLTASYFARIPSIEANEAKRTRRLALVGLDPNGSPAVVPLAMWPQQGDESLAFDVAFSKDVGLLVWDEVTLARPLSVAPSHGAGGRGVIRGVAFDRDPHQRGGPYDVSPPESDAQSPRIVAGPSGFFAFWIASAAEPVADLEAGSGAAPSEATGEARANGWIEMVTLDALGTPKGPVAKLTSERGHVSSYDVLGSDGAATATPTVVARDDGEITDGTGGTLLIVRANENGSDSPVTISSGGLGRGAPAFVDARPPWVTWVGEREDLRMLPLVPPGHVAAVPSVEESLGEARPLLGMVSAPTDIQAPVVNRILAVVPAQKDENGPRAAVVVCAPL
jgi:hypothetical protein